MKSLADLKLIREKAKESVIMRQENPNNIRVVVGMATCGIAAGARPVLISILEAVKTGGLDNVMVTQMGCIGLCKLEPIVEVHVPGQKKVTYVKVTPETAAQIVAEHLVNGQVVDGYTIGAAL